MDGFVLTGGGGDIGDLKYHFTSHTSATTLAMGEARLECHNAAVLVVLCPAINSHLASSGRDIHSLGGRAGACPSLCRPSCCPREISPVQSPWAYVFIDVLPSGPCSHGWVWRSTHNDTGR